MKKYAIINGQNVINIIEYENQPNNPPDGFESPVIAVETNLAGIGWSYIDGNFIAPIQPMPINDDLLKSCKEKAKGLLSQSDWAVLPDVSLKNKDEFVFYRLNLRNLVRNPVSDPNFEVIPEPIWE